MKDKWKAYKGHPIRQIDSGRYKTIISRGTGLTLQNVSITAGTAELVKEIAELAELGDNAREHSEQAHEQPGNLKDAPTKMDKVRVYHADNNCTLREAVEAVNRAEALKASRARIRALEQSGKGEVDEKSLKESLVKEFMRGRAHLWKEHAENYADDALTALRSYLHPQPSASIPAAQELDATDQLCIRRDFEEWASLPPGLLLSKDGDDDYEDGMTRFYFSCFEHAYTKGMWGADRKVNGGLCDRVAELEASISSAEEVSAAVVVALKFYADTGKYVSPLTGGMGDLYFDCGQKAKDALAAIQKGPSDEQ